MKGRLQFDDLPSVCQAFECHPVRLQCFQATQTHPSVEQIGISQALDRHQFVVALQEYRFMRLTVFDQSIDSFARRRAAIDIVAQKNVNRS